MGRPKLYDRDQVLQKAMELFWDKGYHASSISDLELAMGINKFGIYQTFGSKRELMLAAVDRFTEVYQRPTFALLDPKNPRHSILEFFQRARNVALESGHRGCLLLMLGMEFNQEDPDLQGRIATLYRELESRLKHCLEAAKKRGELAPGISPTAVASFLRTYLEGILSRSRHGGGEETTTGIQVLESLFFHRR